MAQGIRGMNSNGHEVMNHLFGVRHSYPTIGPPLRDVSFEL
jgi:hypothetical protein